MASTREQLTNFFLNPPEVMRKQSFTTKAFNKAISKFLRKIGKLYDNGLVSEGEANQIKRLSEGLVNAYRTYEDANSDGTRKSTSAAATAASEQFHQGVKALKNTHLTGSYDQEIILAEAFYYSRRLRKKTNQSAELESKSTARAERIKNFNKVMKAFEEKAKDLCRYNNLTVNGIKTIARKSIELVYDFQQHLNRCQEDPNYDSSGDSITNLYQQFEKDVISIPGFNTRDIRSEWNECLCNVFDSIFLFNSTRLKGEKPEIESFNNAIYDFEDKIQELYYGNRITLNQYAKIRAANDRFIRGVKQGMKNKSPLEIKKCHSLWLKETDIPGLENDPRWTWIRNNIELAIIALVVAVEILLSISPPLALVGMGILAYGLFAPRNHSSIKQEVNKITDATWDITLAPTQEVATSKSTSQKVASW